MSLTAANAQSSSPDIRVEVTGSNIKRVEGEGALPVQVITREEIDRTGATTVTDICSSSRPTRRWAMISIANTIGAQTFSVQTASLRGLGGQNTLVLLNGKRLTQASGEIQGVYGVNLDSIPFSAIERVEVLKDGASAIYGSDAIGGVINFITRNDYRGIEATAYYGAPTRGGGGEIGSATLSAGFGDLSKDRYNVWGSLLLQQAEVARPEQARLLATAATSPTPARSASRATRSRRTSRPAASAASSTRTASRPSRSRAASSPRPIAASSIRRTRTACNSIPEVETISFFGSGKFQINADWQAYATGAWTRVGQQLRHPADAVSAMPSSTVPNGDIPATITISRPARSTRRPRRSPRASTASR